MQREVAEPVALVDDKVKTASPSLTSPSAATYVVIKRAIASCTFAADNYGAMRYAVGAEIAVLQAAFGIHYNVGCTLSMRPLEMRSDSVTLQFHLTLF